MKTANLSEGAGDPQHHTPHAIDVNAGWRLPFTGLLCKQPPYGGIRAIEIATGKTIWGPSLRHRSHQWPIWHALNAASHHWDAQ